MAAGGPWCEAALGGGGCHSGGITFPLGEQLLAALLPGCLAGWCFTVCSCRFAASVPNWELGLFHPLVAIIRTNKHTNKIKSSCAFLCHVSRQLFLIKHDYPPPLFFF